MNTTKKIQQNGKEIDKRYVTIAESQRKSTIRLTVLIVVQMIGWLAAYYFYFRIEYNLWPGGQKVEIECEATSADSTYEVPWHYQGIKTSIPIRVSWHVSKPFEFFVDIKSDISRKRPIRIDRIDTSDNNWSYRDLDCSLGDFLTKHLELEYSDIGKARSFTVIVWASSPSRLESNKRIGITLVPWSHTSVLSTDSVYESEDAICDVQIRNEGAPSSFVVIYEAYEIVDGKRTVYVEGRLGKSEDNKRIIRVDKNSEYILEPEAFYFKREGNYLIKTYVVKYHEYLMKNWDFWFQYEEEKITYDDIIKECKSKGIDLWRYSDRHILRRIDVVKR